MSARKYICTHCDHTFEVGAQDTLRCPSCMRQVGLVPVTEDAPRAASNVRLRLWTAVGLALATVAGVYVATRPTTPAEKPEDPTQQAPAKKKTLKTTDVPAKFAVRADESGTKNLVIPKRVAQVKPTLQAIVALVSWARKSGKIPARSRAPADINRVPRSFDVYLPAFTGKKAPGMGEFEWASLVVGIAKKRGLKLKMGFDRAKRHSAMTLDERRYVVGREGAWVAYDGEKVRSKDVQILSRDGILANNLAWRAISEVEYDPEFAIEAMGYAKALAPKDKAIAFLLGRVQIASGLEDVGFSTLETLAANANDAMAHFTIGELALESKRLFKAQQALSRAAAQDKHFGEPLVLLAEVTLARHEVTPDKQKPALLKEVKATLDRAQKADPQVFGLRTVRSKLAEIEGKPADALRLLEEEFKAHPKRTGAAVNLAQHYVAKERAADARKVYERALNGGNQDPVIYVQLANALLQHENDVEGAITQLKEAIALSPDHPEIRLLLAEVYLQRRNFEPATGVLKEQMKRFPKDIRAPLLLAQVAMTQKKFDDARALLTPILAQDKDNRDAALLLYLTAILSGKDLIGARARAVRVMEGRLALAQTLMQQLQFKEAGVLIDEEIARRPKDEQAYLLRVVVHAAQGEEKLAEAVMAKRLAAAGKAQAKELKGQYEEALAGGKKMRQALEAMDTVKDPALAPPPTP